MQKNPNAIVGGGSGVAGGVAVVYVLSLFGIDVDPMVGAIIAGGFSAVVLFLGREGVRGLFRLVWRGRS
jgi:hypothetical protein